MADEGTKKNVLLTKKGVLPHASTDALKGRRQQLLGLLVQRAAEAATSGSTA